MVKPPFHPKRRSTNGLRSLSKLSEPLISRSVRDRGALLNQILILWPQIAGEAAIWSRPIAVSMAKKDRSDTVLKVEIDSGRGPMATMMIPDLITAVNKACGFSAIHHIRLQQTSIVQKRESPKRVKALPAQQLDEVTNQISSPELRASLIRIGKRLQKS